jgi:hypothetical protein
MAVAARSRAGPGRFVALEKERQRAKATRADRGAPISPYDRRAATASGGPILMKISANSGLIAVGDGETFASTS